MSSAGLPGDTEEFTAETVDAEEAGRWVREWLESD